MRETLMRMKTMVVVTVVMMMLEMPLHMRTTVMLTMPSIVQ